MCTSHRVFVCVSGYRLMGWGWQFLLFYNLSFASELFARRLGARIPALFSNSDMRLSEITPTPWGIAQRVGRPLDSANGGLLRKGLQFGACDKRLLRAVAAGRLAEQG